MKTRHIYHVFAAVKMETLYVCYFSEYGNNHVSDAR